MTGINSGSSVVGVKGPVEVDASGTPVPVTDNGGSLTVDSPQLPAALGQGTMAQSLPVALASDQSDVPVATNAEAARDASITQSQVGLLVRQIRDMNVSIAAGDIAGLSWIFKYGANHAVGGTYEPVWTGSAAYPGWITSASTVRVASGGDVNDTVAGSGARKIIVIGLDENWEDAEEEIELAGAAASASTTTTFIRVFRAYVSEAGTYASPVNVDDIVIETTGGTTLAQIDGDEGQTLMCLYTVPAGKTAYLYRVNMSSSQVANQEANFRLFKRENADVTSAPVSSNRVIMHHHGLSGHAGMAIDCRISFPEKTDIWMEAQQGGSQSPEVGADVELLLVDN